MKKAFTVIFLILITSFGIGSTLNNDSIQGKIFYMTYVNARYQFEVLFPKDLLKPNPPPDNNDGRSFDSDDKQVYMVVWGGYNVMGNTWKEDFKSALDGFEDAQITYKIFKKNMFVISGMRKDKIFYRKQLRVTEEGGEVFLGFEIEYPKKDKEIWNAIAAKCANSFKRSKVNIPTDTNAMGLGTNFDQFK